MSPFSSVSPCQHEGQNSAATEMSSSPFSWWGASPCVARVTQYFKNWPSHAAEFRKSWCCHRGKYPCHLIPTWYHIFHYINRSDCSINQINAGLKLIWKKKKKRQVLIMHFPMQPCLAAAQGEGLGWGLVAGRRQGCFPHQDSFMLSLWDNWHFLLHCKLEIKL